LSLNRNINEWYIEKLLRFPKATFDLSDQKSGLWDQITIKEESISKQTLKIHPVAQPAVSVPSAFQNFFVMQ